MEIQLTYKGKNYKADLSRPRDISLPVAAGEGHVRAWYLPPVIIEPVRMGDWTGAVTGGASVNFRNILFNPHGHGTHTETIGHISPEIFSVNSFFREFFCFVILVSILPEQMNGDQVITRDQLAEACPETADAIIIRTMPQDPSRRTRNYSHTNPPYLHEAAAVWLREKGVRHLLIDTPSVDREEDGGQLLSHRAFWNYPGQPRFDATITELVYADEEVPDGLYFMNLQVAPIENDAAPSRPLLFALYAC